MIKTVYVAGKAIDISMLSSIGKGGEGDIYRVNPSTALKIYKTPDHPDLTEPADKEAARVRLEIHQKKLREFPRGLPGHVIVPLRLATDKTGNTIHGYTMQLVSDREVIKMLSQQSFRANTMDNDKVGAVLRDMHKTISSLHNANVQIGDFNDLNVLVNARDPMAYFIDADSFQFGSYYCYAYTERFADPLLCDIIDKRMKLAKQHTNESDWYAYTIILMQSLLYAGPYDGVYVPKDHKLRIAPNLRPMQRITVFNPEVRYPKTGVAAHFSVLPDDLLQYFHEVFEKDKRGEFPIALLNLPQWTTCSNCGLYHARNICPDCSAAVPGMVKEVLTIHGKVKSRRILQTSGRILFAAVQNGRMRYLYHEDGKYIRDGDSVILHGNLEAHMRYRVFGNETLIGKGNQLVTIPAAGARPIVVDAVGNLSMFDANSHHKYYASYGILYRNGEWGTLYKLADIMKNQTIFWVGEDFGFGFYRAGEINVYFMFDANSPSVNDAVELPRINGYLIDSTCVFGKNQCWFILNYQDKGIEKNRCYVLDRHGKLLATAEAEPGDGSWLGKIRGKTAVGNYLMSATDDGIVRLEVNGGKIIENARFPDTEPFVNAETNLFVASDGIYAVNQREIYYLTIEQ